MKAVNVVDLWRYPVKGFAGQSLDRKDIKQGKGLPYDRRWGVVNPANRKEAEAELHPSCDLFRVVRSDPEAASISFSIDDEQNLLELNEGGRSTAVWGLAEEGLCNKVAKEIGERLRWPGVEVVDHGFSPLWDYGNAPFSIANVRSIESLAQAADMELDPRRFRANILIDGLEPWEERSWPGTDVSLPGGLQFRVVREIPRCRATCVNPDTLEIDVKVPSILRRAFGHDNLGVLAFPITSGRLEVEGTNP